MKSWRLNRGALTWLQGGHQTAPQYRNSGLLSALAARKAASTSPLRQAMPSAWVAKAGSGGLLSVAAVGPERWGGSGACEHATTARVRARLSWRGEMGMVARQAAGAASVSLARGKCGRGGAGRSGQAWNRALLTRRSPTSASETLRNRQCVAALTRA